MLLLQKETVFIICGESEDETSKIFNKCTIILDVRPFRGHQRSSGKLEAVFESFFDYNVWGI